MKRSEINAILKDADAFIRSFGFLLPPFANWSPQELRDRMPRAPGILEGALGWDLTDFGLERFAEAGLVLFTIRNGRLADLDAGRGKVYAEKVMVVRRDQRCLMHHHLRKSEDIINRGGGALCLELFTSRPDGTPDERAPVEVASDGTLRRLPAGGVLRLAPGESVTLHPDTWHAFWAEGADLLAGEVSTVNDDLADNVFRDPVGRFATVEEDAEPWRLLVSDYPRP